MKIFRGREMSYERRHFPRAINLNYQYECEVYMLGDLNHLIKTSAYNGDAKTS